MILLITHNWSNHVGSHVYNVYMAIYLRTMILYAAKGWPGCRGLDTLGDCCNNDAVDDINWLVRGVVNPLAPNGLIGL